MTLSTKEIAKEPESTKIEPESKGTIEPESKEIIKEPTKEIAKEPTKETIESKEIAKEPEEIIKECIVKNNLNQAADKIIQMEEENKFCKSEYLKNKTKQKLKELKESYLSQKGIPQLVSKLNLGSTGGMNGTRTNGIIFPATGKIKETNLPATNNTNQTSSLPATGKIKENKIYKNQENKIYKNQENKIYEPFSCTELRIENSKNLKFEKINCEFTVQLIGVSETVLNCHSQQIRLYGCRNVFLKNVFTRTGIILEESSGIKISFSTKEGIGKESETETEGGIGKESETETEGGIGSRENGIGSVENVTETESETDEEIAGNCQMVNDISCPFSSKNYTFV